MRYKVCVIDATGDEVRFFRRNLYGDPVAPWRKVTRASAGRLSKVLAGSTCRIYNNLTTYYPNVLTGGTYRT